MEFRLDGRALRFTLKAIRHFKDTYRKPLWRVRLQGPGEVEPEIAIDHVCMMHALWAGLLHGDPDLTYEQTEDLVQKYIDDGGDIYGIAKAILDAFDASGLFGERNKLDADTDPNDQGGKVG